MEEMFDHLQGAQPGYWRCAEHKTYGWKPDMLCDKCEIARLRAEVARQKAIIENPALLQWVPAHLLDAAQAEAARLTQERDAFNAAGALDPENATELAAAHDALRACVTQLVGALREVERHCPCGARGESLRTHSHVIGCPVSTALAAATKLLG